MGTRSRIGLAVGPDQIISVYCHYDGYIQNNGRILRDKYTTKEQVQELIDGGGMSCLETKQTWDSKPLKRRVIRADGETELIYMEHPDGSWIMDIEKEIPGPMYYTERGEEIEVCMSTFDEFLSDDCGEEWCYLFTPDHGWQCWKLGWGETNTVEYNFDTEEPLRVLEPV
jgi:hypothetical protein|tara:strand:- start:90 stop:599 length:510 start_codon:yes stop_codon:yes gene_type:complete